LTNTGRLDARPVNGHLRHAIGEFKTDLPHRCMPDGEIYLHVHSNTGDGFFSQGWIALQDILQVLKKPPEGKPITSILINSLCRGKSANTPALPLAVLRHEKSLRPIPGKLRRHEFMDTTAYKTKVEWLPASGTEAKGRTAGRPVGKAPIKKSTSPSRREMATPD
jgi:hypothetical protein